MNERLAPYLYRGWMVHHYVELPAGESFIAVPKNATKGKKWNRAMLRATEKGEIESKIDAVENARRIPTGSGMNESFSDRVVSLLLDAVQAVEVEYHTAEIDSMPHTTWLIRAVGADPSGYIAKGTGHTRQDAERQVNEKVRLLGVQIANVIDQTKQLHDYR